jgi:hypothetical protein
MKLSVLALCLSLSVLAACSGSGGGGGGSNSPDPTPVNANQFKPLSVSEIEQKFSSLQFCQNKVEIKKVGPTVEEYSVKISCRVHAVESLVSLGKEIKQIWLSLTHHSTEIAQSKGTYSLNEKNYVSALKSAMYTLDYGFLFTFEKGVEELDKPDARPKSSEVSDWTTSTFNQEGLGPKVCQASEMGDRFGKLAATAKFAQSLSYLHRIKMIRVGWGDGDEIEASFLIGGYSIKELSQLATNLDYAGVRFLNERMKKIIGATDPTLTNMGMYAGDDLSRLKTACLMNQVLDNQVIQDRLVSGSLPRLWRVDAYEWNKEIQVKAASFQNITTLEIDMPGDKTYAPLNVSAQSVVDRILEYHP